MSLPKAKVCEPVDFTKWHFSEESLDSFIGKIVQDTFEAVWADDPPCAMLTSSDPDTIVVFPFGEDDCNWEFSLSELIDETRDVEFLGELRKHLETLADRVSDRILKREADPEF